MRRNRNPVVRHKILANAHARYCQCCGLFAIDNTTQARIQGGICTSCQVRKPLHDKKRVISQWAQKMLQHEKWVMLDTETTGRERSDEVIELAVIDRAETVHLDTLVRPQGVIPFEATSIHGITQEMTQNAPTFLPFLKSGFPYRKLLGNTPL